MAFRGSRRSLAHLWQAPLLLLSLGLFGYAAYLFIDPQPGLTLDQKIDVARVYLKNERPEAAISTGPMPRSSTSSTTACSPPRNTRAKAKRRST